jgi:ferredoxin
MDAFTTEKAFKPDDCNLCMDCIADCPDARTAFRFSRRRTPVPPVDLSRRAALATVAVGLTTPLVVKAARIGRPATVDPLLIRPPGAGDEAAFLDRCIRCGLCMKVCPTNGLQPAALLAGIEGIFSPRLVPRIGYCQPDCTLCGQVCPTGAIPRLDVGSKSRVVLGKAVIDQTRCLPWANNEPCVQCQEHCPTADNAIGYDVEAVNSAGQRVLLKRPFVQWNRCTGCGICENKCPVDGESAIQVRRTESVPRGQGRGRGGGGGRQARRGGGQRRGAGRERGAE